MNCKIVGYEFKTLEVTLSPGEDFYGEVGSMVYMEEGIDRSLGEGLSTNFIEGPGKIIISPSPLPNVKDPVSKFWGCFIVILFYAVIFGIAFLLN